MEEFNTLEATSNMELSSEETKNVILTTVVLATAAVGVTVLGTLGVTKLVKRVRAHRAEKNVPQETQLELDI
jgi:hypothetical protein